MTPVVRISRQRAFRALNLVALSADAATIARIDEPAPSRAHTGGVGPERSR